MTQIDDSLIKKKIWDGSIPVVFTLAPHEVTSLQQPHPYYVMVSRISYLTNYVQEVKSHFEKYVTKFDKDNEVWFEYKDQPLKWHIPSGVLYDLCAQNTNLPWQIVVHFQQFPSDKISKVSSEKDVLWNYINSIKEAMQIQFGSTKSIMSLAKQDQEKLWESIKECDISEFEKIKKMLSEGDELKKYPIRVYTDTDLPSSLYSLVVKKGESENKSLGAFMQEIMPNEFADLKAERLPKVIIHGIQPSLETPLQWLCVNCSHPDNFLYITVITKL